MILPMVDKKIQMNEGDFGIDFYIYLKPKTGDNIEDIIEKTDVFKFFVTDNIEDDENRIIEKELEDLSFENNRVKLTLNFTKEESDRLPAGYYMYGIALYRGEVLLNTLIGAKEFEVIEGA